MNSETAGNSRAPLKNIKVSDACSELVALDKLRVVQANVSTLNPCKLKQVLVQQCLSATPRTVVLDSMFGADTADLVFVQESRLPHDGE